MDRTRKPVPGDLRVVTERLCDQLADIYVSADHSASVETRLRRFELFCSKAFNIGALDEVTPAVAGAFIDAPRGEEPPTLRERHRRRAAIRLLYGAARADAPDAGDPTLDIRLPSRAIRRGRPLTDDEVALCRASATWSLSDSRHAACWALAEATCRTGELPYIKADDIDLEGGRVWLHGGRRTTARWGELTSWGLAQLARRVHATDGGLVYGGGDPRDGGRISSSLALQDVLKRAGVHDPGVRPSSITAWAGRRTLAETGRIDVVAQRLGLRSLDRTASFIDWDWQQDAHG